MKKGIIAMEDLGHDEVLAAAAVCEAADLANAAEPGVIDLNADMNRREEESEIMGYTGDLSETVKVNGEVEEVIDQLESTNEGGVEGLSGPACEALQIAINGLLKRAGVDKAKMAFEERTTLVAKRRNVTAALEGFRDVLRKIWDRIISLLEKIVGWFKRVFTRRKLRSQVQKARIDKATASVAGAKRDEATKVAERAPDQTLPQVPGVFMNPSVARRLMVGNEVPSGPALVARAQDHVNAMRKISDAFLEQDDAILRTLDKSYNAVHVDGPKFQEAFGELLGNIVSSRIPTRCPNQQYLGHFSKGVVLYELPLAFGNQSYFRTGADRSGEWKVADTVAHVAAASHQPANPKYDAPLKKLEMVQVEVLLKIIRAQWEHGKLVGELFDDNNENLDALIGKTKQLGRATGKDEQRASARARKLSEAYSMYTILRSSVVGQLMGYDEAVMDALLAYVEASLSLT